MKQTTKLKIVDPLPDAEGYDKLIKTHLFIKVKYQDAIVIVRGAGGGDMWYHTFYKDAEAVNKVFPGNAIQTLTSGVKIYTFHFQYLDKYLNNLVKAGHRVAICDELIQSKKNEATANTPRPASSISKPVKQEEAICQQELF